MSKRIRLAVVGGRRGAHFNQALEALAERTELVAVCDVREEMLANWQKIYPGVRTFNDYNRLLEDPDVDAVFLATPLFIHAEQAVEALRAGKHVLSEVIASHTIEDSWKLIEAVEETGLTYMMAENYCYMRPNMMVNHMSQHGLFGELTYAECGYTHDIRNLLHYEDGSLTWRGKLLKDYKGSTYPTHSLGPIAQWLGVNQQGGDELESLVTFGSKSRATAKYFHEHFGEQHPGADNEHWQTPDSTVTLIRTKKGMLIALKYDIQSARPQNMTHYTLQGTTGSYLSSRHANEDPLIWLEGRSPGGSPYDKEGKTAEWESLWQYADEWEHPRWKNLSEIAAKSGHGGGDFFVLDEFFTAIIEKRKPAIDVYDAVTWSSVFPLSIQSMAAGGQSVPFVKFFKNK